MQFKMSALLFVAAALCLAAFTAADDMSGMNMSSSSPPATQPATLPSQAVDLRNTVCPVSGDHLGNMGAPVKITAEGRTFYLCCKSCQDDVKADPKAVIAKLDKK